jgi:hypothetical protein
MWELMTGSGQTKRSGGGTMTIGDIGFGKHEQTQGKY